MSETNLFRDLFAIMAGDASAATKGFSEFYQYVKDAKQASKQASKRSDKPVSLQNRDSLARTRRTSKTSAVKTKA